MSNSYSKKELQLLCYMLIKQEYVDCGCQHREMAHSIIDNNYNLQKAYTSGYANTEEDALLLHAITPHNQTLWDGHYWDPKTIHYMKNTPYNQIPLYINDRILGVFTKWRLLIGH